MSLELIAHVFPLAMGPVVAILVETAKRVPVIPVGPHRASIVAALIVASLAVRLALAWATGQLETFAWEAELRIAIDAIMAAVVAAGGYSLIKR